MANVLHALLDNVSNSSERAAISAGWEIGAGLCDNSVRPDEIMRQQIVKASRAVCRSMSLDIDLVHGAALLAMVLQEKL